MSLLVAAGACGDGPRRDAAAPLDEVSSPIAVDSAATAVTLIDPAIPPAVAGEGGWHYSQSAETDLDGDGQAERVVLAAQVEMVRGRPAWDDGQPWQAYVEEPTGERTRVYARFVQLGTVTLRVGMPEDSGEPTIVLLEHLPDRLAVYEAMYRGPGQATATTRFSRRVDPRGELASPDLP